MRGAESPARLEKSLYSKTLRNILEIIGAVGKGCTDVESLKAGMNYVVLN